MTPPSSSTRGGHRGAAARTVGNSKAKCRRPNYRRRVKPPYSFAELIAMAIRDSPCGRLTLWGIKAHMAATYECFRGPYVGWQNSVRHNLTVRPCFVKILKDPTKPQGKDNFWAMNPDCPHCRTVEGGFPAGDQPGHSPAPKPETDASPEECINSAAACPTAEAEGSGVEGLPLAKPAPRPGIAVQGVSVSQADGVSAYHKLSPGPSATTPPSKPPTTSSDSASNPASDEWDLVGDLYIPDNDIDLSLYSDDCLSHSSQLHQRSSTDSYSPVSRSLMEFKGPPASSSSTESSFAPPCNAAAQAGLSSAYPTVTLSVKMRIKTERRSPTLSRYHPYDHLMHPSPSPSRLREPLGFCAPAPPSARHQETCRSLPDCAERLRQRLDCCLGHSG